MHIRNADHHHAVSGHLIVLSENGAILKDQALAVPPLTTIDYQMAAFTSARSATDSLAGTLLFDYESAYDGLIQAEVSIRDDKRTHAYTLVGRPAILYKQPLFLAYDRPKPTTYLEYAVSNPSGRALTFTISTGSASTWQDVGTFTIPPFGVKKARIEGSTLTAAESSAPRLAGLVRVTVLTPETFPVLGAWLEDEATGYSNTVLFHDVLPNTNTLWASQVVIGEFPKSVLDAGPAFSASLIFANIGTDPVEVRMNTSCDNDEGRYSLPPIRLTVMPLAQAHADLSSELRKNRPGTSAAVCNVEATYTGPPGLVFGRYFGVSQNQTYGLYVRMEPALGRGYSEVYWTTEGDFLPLLTVANFLDRNDKIDVFLVYCVTRIEYYPMRSGRV